MLCRQHRHGERVAFLNAACHLPLNASISEVVSLFNISLQKNFASGLFLGHQVFPVCTEAALIGGLMPFLENS